MPDINTYALGLELKLQFEPAMHAVDSLIGKVKSLQNIAVKAAQAIKASQGDTSSDEEFIKVKEQLSLMLDNYANIQEKYKVTALDSNTATFLSEQATVAYSDALESVAKQQQAAEAQIHRFIKAHKEYKDELTEITEDKFVAFSQKVTKNSQLIDKYTKNLRTHKDMMLAVMGGIKGLNKETQHLGSIISAAAGKFGVMGAVVLYLWSGFKNVVSMQDAYAKATFRSIGTTNELIASSNQLRMSFGASSDEAVATFTALAQAGFSAKDRISKLAEVNYKFSKITGISSDITALYQKRIVALIGSSEQATKNLTAIASAIRRSGLSAQEASGMMSQFNDTMLEVSFLYNPQDAAELSVELIKLSGAVKGAGGNFQTMIGQLQPLLTDPLKAVAGFAKVNAVFDENATATENMNVYLVAASAKIKELGKQGKLSRSALADALGINKQFAGSLMLLDQKASEAGKGITEYYQAFDDTKNLDAQFSEATATLTEQLKMLLTPLLTVAAQIGSVIVPVLTEMITLIRESTVASAIFGAMIAAAMGVAFLVTISKAVGAVKGMLGVFNIFKGSMKVMADSTSSLTAERGVGMKSFFTNLAGGIGAMGTTPGVFPGIIALGLLAVVVGGTLLAVAATMKVFGISVADLVGAAVGLVVAAAAFYVLAAALVVLGPVAVAVAPLLLPLSLVFLAIGASVLMASFGISLMVKAFTELFKVALSDGWMFLTIIGTMTLLMYPLALGLYVLAAALVISAPAILAGFGMLFIASLMGLLIGPVLEKVGVALQNIGSAALSIGPGAGLALISLAAGITAFMASLMGIAVVGAAGGIASLFGVKSPLKQAEEIAAAMKAIATPASSLSGSLVKIGAIGDVFKPFIEGILGRKEEIKRAAAVLEDLALRVEAVKKSIGEDSVFAGFPSGPFTLKADPVRKPLITEDTARKIRDERAQYAMVTGTKDMKKAIDNIGDKMGGDSSSMGQLIELLKTWLPKLAKSDKDASSLTSMLNQW
jgi:hypothetical protein